MGWFDLGIMRGMGRFSSGMLTVPGAVGMAFLYKMTSGSGGNWFLIDRLSLGDKHVKNFLDGEYFVHFVDILP